MKIITAIKSWFFGEKPLANHRWKFLSEISSVGCTEAEKRTAVAGLIGPLLGCSWRRAPAGGQDLGHAPPSDPRAPARLLPHPSGSWRGLPRCSPFPEPCPAAVQGLRGAPLPSPSLRSLFMGKEESSGAVMDNNHAPGCCWAGEGEHPWLSSKTNSWALPRAQHALPCWL